VLSRSLTSREHFRRGDISRYFWVNGYPPPDEDYQRLAAGGFADYRLAAMVLGSYAGNRPLALAIGLLGLFLILVFHVVITVFSLRYKRATQHLLGIMVNPFECLASGRG